MNVSGMPFQAEAYGFWLACGLMAVSVAVMLVVLKRIRLI
jgi:Mg2+ and Co2+ transporter CorA